VYTLYNEDKSPAYVIGMAILAIVLEIVIMPLIVSIWLLFEGWILSLFMGNILCQIAIIFGLDISTKQIPFIFLIIGWIGYALQCGPDIVAIVTDKIDKITSTGYENEDNND
jgi:hypothetical protein